MVHDRRLDDRVLTLRVSGKVRDGNLVMYDQETGTLWLQKTGAALQGPLVAKKLKELLKSQFEPGIRWDRWLSRHPQSKVMQCNHCLRQSKAPAKQ